MLAARLMLRSGGIKPSLLSGKQNFVSKIKLHTTVKEKPKTSIVQGFMERLRAPTTGASMSLGKGFLAGSSACALAGLFYYGMGLSKKRGAIDTHVSWPEIVRDRIRTTYAYFGGGILFTAATAVLASKSSFVMNFCMKSSPLVFIGVTIASYMAAGWYCQSLPFTEGFGKKQVAYLLYTGLHGLFLAPLTLLGGPLLVRAACYTTGIIGGLSTLAVCAPSDKFLYIGGPLAMGAGVVFVATIGSIFIPTATALGAGLHSMYLYGGLVLFGAYLLHDTQKIIKSVQNSSYYYDPVNRSMGIYLDTLHIFTRMLFILSEGPSKRGRRR